MKFKIGDKVKIIKSNVFYDTGKNKDLGFMGEIVDCNADMYDYTVKFDKEYSFTHDCDNYTENLYRWYNSDNLGLVKENNMKTNLFANGNFILIDSKWGIIIDNIIIYESGQ